MKKIFFAFTLIIFAALVLLYMLNLLPPEIKGYLSWKTVLIAIGVLTMFSKGSRLTGFMLVIVGVIFMFPDIKFQPNYLKIVFPIIVCVMAVIVLMRIGVKRHQNQDKKEL